MIAATNRPDVLDRIDASRPFRPLPAFWRNRTGAHHLCLTNKMMAGNLWVESEEGQGSRFNFTMVAGVAEAQAGLAQPVSLQGCRALGG